MNTTEIWRREKRLLVLWMTIFALFFYLTLPLALTFLPDMMKASPIGSLSWAWIYAFAQVIMTWILGWVYWRKAKQLDELVAMMEQEATK